MAAGLGCFADMNGELAAIRARVRAEMLIAGLYQQPKGTTLNLKQNELLALIATYSRELNQMIEARSNGAGNFRDEHGPALKGLVQSHVARIAQLSAELA